SGPLEISPGPAWQVAGLGDFDGDGNAYDILWRHELIGNNSIWFMDGRSLRPDSGRIQHLDDLDWAVAATGDFDGDGKSDIMWRHAVTGRNSLWLMDGRTLLPGSGPLPTVTHPAWTVVGAGDFNGDGMCDVLWRHGIIGRNTMWLMDGTSKLPGSGALPEVNDPEWRIVGTGDFDGDGKCDILWRNGVTGRNTMWLMDGKTRQRSSGSIQEIPQREWKVMGTVDFDGDGMSDIFWRNTLNGKNSLWLMDGRQLREGTASIQPLPDPDWTVVGTAD
ncbi:MAG: FG-GAP repeat domain-containing protein, partial [Planctomycetota bacterium]